MKKSPVFMQRAILNEVTLAYTTRDIADEMISYLEDQDINLVVYETHSDAIVFRKKRDLTVTDDQITEAFVYAIQELVHKSEKGIDNIVDILSDNYDFEYDKSYINKSFISEVIIIRRSGKLISVEIDV